MEERNFVEEYSRKLEFLQEEAKEDFWYIIGRIDESYGRNNFKYKNKEKEAKEKN
ncbi:hypothetical protein UMC2_35831 [[Clostridium] sordellii]|uniref:hypothetical protein n=1 Tax=Paraclostridium sordellii TaxID=1505 RepID=UPI000541F8AF|nr:hypothetical protein [Paeniclostridium sordellii]CEK34372.1 hypothetical protein UMC2_35831 [[Clostridium] sordellii] [Paeniclostridium sordellii]